MHIPNLVALAVGKLTKPPRACAAQTNGSLPLVPVQYLVCQSVWEAAQMHTFNSSESRGVV
jgi:hypothetical protein